jgi:hypothetical protein
LGKSLSELGLCSGVVGRRVEIEAKRRLLGDLKARELEVEATQLRVLEALQPFLATTHVLTGPDRHELGTGLDQLVDELLVVGIAEVAARLGP